MSFKVSCRYRKVSYAICHHVTTVSMSSSSLNLRSPHVSLQCWKQMIIARRLLCKQQDIPTFFSCEIAHHVKLYLSVPSAFIQKHDLSLKVRVKNLGFFLSPEHYYYIYLYCQCSLTISSFTVRNRGDGKRW